MSKLLSRIIASFRNRTFMGVDKAGNQYFLRNELIDGLMKEKRWVIFKKEDDPTSIPVEWICWLNGQRKKAPTTEEMEELEARRERVRQNVALLKKEEEERKLKEGVKRKGTANIGKSSGPDLGSFIRQFPASSEGGKVMGETETVDRMSNHPGAEKEIPVPESSEPTGSGQSYRPGMWQPPA